MSCIPASQLAGLVQRAGYTALEVNAEVPKMEVVTERLLHKERKLKDRMGTDEGGAKAMAADQRSKRKGPKVLPLWKVWPYQKELQRTGSDC